MSLLNNEMIEKEAKRLNKQNIELLNTLKEYFGDQVPIFMDAVSEEELPKDNMTYIFVETGNYVINDPSSKSMQETVTINYFMEGRENPTLDRLTIVKAGLQTKLKMRTSTQETIVLDDTSRLIGLFVCEFTRPALKGCV